MNRRDFLCGALAAAGCGAFGGCRSLLGGRGVEVAGLRIGVQMWSVDKLWKKDPAGAFRRLKALGYDGVQSFGFLAMDWNELEKMLDGEGLQIVDMPFYLKNTASGEFERFVEFCRRFGIGFAYEPFIRFKTGEEWKRHFDTLVALGGKFARHGIRVGYHNHQHELRESYGGTTPLEMMCASGLAAELDVGHVRLAGGDPVAWLKRFAGRVPSIHAKPGGGNAVGGAGDRNDWKAIFAAARAAGTAWAVVECETRRDTYADVEASIAFLKGLNA